MTLLVFLQVVDFMVSLLQRACVGLDQATGPNRGNPVESQTLSMGIGLVATLLSGPEVLLADNMLLIKLCLPYDACTVFYVCSIANCFYS